MAYILLITIKAIPFPHYAARDNAIRPGNVTLTMTSIEILVFKDTSIRLSDSSVKGTVRTCLTYQSCDQHKTHTILFG